MMYDPLALDRQRQNEENLRRRTACALEQPVRRGPKPPREAHRRHGMLRRFTTAISSS